MPCWCVSFVTPFLIAEGPGMLGVAKWMLLLQNTVTSALATSHTCPSLTAHTSPTCRWWPITTLAMRRLSTVG